MSISGLARRNPRRMRPSRSASAWNLIRMAGALKLGNQFRVGLFRLLMLRFSGALAFGEISVDLELVGEIKRERSVDLFEC